MARLWQPFARNRRIRETIALDQRDTLEMIRQDAAGKQPCNAAADDHGVPEGMVPHGVSPTLRG